jgi:hypothetical protein
MTAADDKVSVTLGKCEIKDSFDPKYKTTMPPVIGAAFKKGIDASGDFVFGPGSDEGKSFLIKVSMSISKDDKSKPPKVKVSAEATGLYTGGRSSGQQFAAQSNIAATTGSKIDNDVKLTVQDAMDALTAKNGKMLQAMRNFVSK